MFGRKVDAVVVIDDKVYEVEYKNCYGRVLAGTQVVGLDAAIALLERAQELHPELDCTARKVGRS